MAQDNWSEKGATLSDKTAIKQFHLEQEEIYAAIREGKLQYREICIYGNPCLRLFTAEVENLVTELHGANYLSQQKLQTELKSVKSQIRTMKSKIKKLEKRKVELLIELETET